MALLGLGLLGAAGALVDYWPVRSALPAVVSALTLPAGLGTPALHATVLPEVSTPARFRSSAAPTVVDADLTIPDAIGANGNDGSLGFADGHAESTEPVGVLPPSLEVASASMATMPVSTIALMPPVITAFEATLEDPLSPQLEPPPQNRGNRLAGAAKTSARAVAWTGTAIGTALAKPFVALGHFLH
jgi:hypothetical protein